MNATRLLATVAVLLSAAPARADIYRWDTGEVIPGTEGIEPGPGVQLDNLDLQYARLAQLDLTASRFDFSNLTNASFSYSALTNISFTGVIVKGASFMETTSKGFTRGQLESTASYRARNLQGIRLGGNDLSGWVFSDQNLTNADFRGFVSTNFADSDMRRADLRGVQYGAVGSSNNPLDDADTTNAIHRNGRIAGLGLSSEETLFVRDYDGDFYQNLPPIPILIEDEMSLAPTATLRLIFEADPWDSTISFEPGIPVELGGTLELTFADDVDVSTQIGRTFRVFDWSGVEPVGTFRVSSPYDWDTSRLYSTGEIALLAVPEPESLMIGALMFISALASWGRFRAIQRSSTR